jgi:two-component system chemotaxis response regulator CheB
MSTTRIRVLVVDDSAFARKVVREVLTTDPQIEVVGIARDGLEALEKVAELKPDVMTLDLQMPDLDGLGVLRALPKLGSPRVVIVSISGSDTEIAIEALHLGAVELVNKPTPLPTDRLYDLSAELISKVKAAYISRPRSYEKPPEVLKQPRGYTQSGMGASAPRLVVIGTSTGGPQALTQLFKSLPGGLPVTFAIALHIPAGYTAPLAARISQWSGVKIEEARDGMELLAGQGVIAPGGMHLKIRQSEGRLYAVTTLEPTHTLHHPSVDVLFNSAADQVGRGVLGVVLTGMGDDGMRGSASIQKASGLVLAESKSSCVVYGMPRCVIEGGYSFEEAPLEEMAAMILKVVSPG